jgi:hypothetical protein
MELILPIILIALSIPSIQYLIGEPKLRPIIYLLAFVFCPFVVFAAFVKWLITARI